MKKKTFFILILCCIIAPTVFVGAYQLGVSSGVAVGFKDGQAYAASQANTPKGPSGSWVEGYNAGVLAAQSGVTPSP
jgi:hypothetical protein